MLRNRNFVLLAAGQGISRVGDGVYAAALAWTAWRIGHDPRDVAIVTFAASAPFVAMIAGASYADRIDRRRLMIASDVARLALVLALALLVESGPLTIMTLALLAALLGIAGAPFAPARNALVPHVVPAAHLPRANALLQVSFRSAYFVGPLVLGPVVAATSIAGAFAVDALTFALSAGMLAAMRIPDGAPVAAIGLWRDLAEGAAELRRTPDVIVVLATFGIAILFTSGFLSVGVAVLVGSSLHGGSGSYGLLIGIAGIAEVAGALLLSVVGVRPRALTAVLAWTVLGVLRFPLGLVHSMTAAATMLAGTGAVSAVTDIHLIGLVQARIPSRHLAKALGTWEATILAASAVSAPIAGVVIARAGAATGFMLSGGALIGLGLGSALILLRLRVPAVRAHEVRP
jgi:transmembrane secretion effector